MCQLFLTMLVPVGLLWRTGIDDQAHHQAMGWEEGLIGVRLKTDKGHR